MELTRLHGAVKNHCLPNTVLPTRMATTTSRFSTLFENERNTLTMITDEVRKFQVHEINEGRKTFGEYHHLFQILKKYPNKFYEYMRMQVDTFHYVLSSVEKHLRKNWCNLHTQPILPEEQFVVTIRFLVTGMSYSDLSFTFRMGVSTVFNAIQRTLIILWKKLYPIHMPVPTEEALLKVADDFYKLWNFPHCIGAIDVRHVPIKQPPNSGKLYYNYKKFFSITLQAIVGAKYKFISIDVGGYGRQHDASTFRASQFFAGLSRGIIKVPIPDKLPNCNTILPYFLIGDGAYPLMENLQKPYPGNNLSPSERAFNKRLSRARLTVECAFGQLHQKWKIFNTTLQCLPHTACSIVKCVCILHNVIIDIEKEDFDVTTERVIQLPRININSDLHNFPPQQAIEIRERLADFIARNPM